MTPQDELKALDDLLESDGWKVLNDKFRPMFAKTVRAALGKQGSVTSIERDRLCERAGALTEILDWPQERTELLEKKINEQVEFPSN